MQVGLELRSGLIQLLPKFHGLPDKDPNKHLKRFHIVCQSFRPQGVDEEQVKLRAFPFSLEDAAQDWLYYLPAGAVNTWTDMVRLFLDKYFFASKVANYRKEICGIKQNDQESFCDYWERFKRMCAMCPHHGISDLLLIQYFYEGLLPGDRAMLDAASGAQS